MKTILTCMTMLFFLSGQSQITFSNSSALFGNADVNSGVAMGVVDMNGDGLDDVVRLHLARHLMVDYQRSDGTKFDHYNPQWTNGSEWGMCISDVDKNGYLDVFTGGGSNGLSLIYFDSSGLDTSVILPDTDIFLQGSNFVDINNDGWIDIYACDDNDLSHAYRNNGLGVYELDLSLISTFSTTPSDNSGNYGSIWTDYDSDGDVDMYLSKCRLGVSDSLDGRRVNQMWQNDGSNNFTDNGSAIGLVPFGQSWSADFGDIDNDGDLDAYVVNHDKLSILYENVNNSFIDITASAGLVPALSGGAIGIQTTFQDFNNDGFVDIFVTGVGGHFIFENNGDKTFTERTNAFPGTTPTIQSTAIGDLNNDGFLDLIAGFANGYNNPSTTDDRLLMNNGNDNNWVKIKLIGNQSNINGIGARVELYNDLGMQVREVRSGEGYGMMNSLTTHFGIDTTTSIDSIVIKWPSGVRDVFCAPDINTFHTLIETCLPTCAGIQFVLEETICKGETYELNGNTYTETGEYSMGFTNLTGCDSSVVLKLTVNEVDVAVDYDAVNMQLNASNTGDSYQWGNCLDNGVFSAIESATNSNYTATTSGDYAVIIEQNSCIDTSVCIEVLLPTSTTNAILSQISLYPNPVNDYLQLSIPEVRTFVNAELFTIDGQLIKQHNFFTAGDQIMATQNLLPGIYVLRLSADEASTTVKIVKH